MEVPEHMWPRTRRSPRPVASTVQPVGACVAVIQAVIAQEPPQEMAAPVSGQRLIVSARTPITLRASARNPAVLLHDDEPSAGYFACRRQKTRLASGSMALYTTRVRLSPFAFAARISAKSDLSRGLSGLVVRLFVVAMT